MGANKCMAHRYDKKTGQFLKNSQRPIINNFGEDNPETAYWAGFIYGDGYLNEVGNLHMCLGPKDANHLRKLSKFICGKDYVGVYKNSCHFQITHEDIAHNLNCWCTIPNKTYDGRLDLDTKYMSDFIRGYFDTDGWASYYWYSCNVKLAKGNLKEYKYIKQCIGICSYHKQNLSYILQFIPEADYTLTLKKNQHLYELRWERKRTIKIIAKYLYHPTISLERKAKKLLAIMNH